ncbi:hypothetical protein DPMN_131607 [Dreissena polymorpha]|uniref:Uncharacterized protein n=1 Tax=Dreissena polymorpha TaxID=45954 RepID=A0A9D4FQ18_DREPO|nr:hypothetical protein DPMN_131607 [Dreissena polymorpha]
MVEPTIWPALEGEIRQKQAEECKTRRIYGRTNHLARYGGDKAETRQKSVRQDGPQGSRCRSPLAPIATK